VTGATPGATYVLSVKYTPNSVVGSKAPNPTTVNYSFAMNFNNGSTVAGSTAGIPLVKK